MKKGKFYLKIKAYIAIIKVKINPTLTNIDNLINLTNYISSLNNNTAFKLSHQIFRNLNSLKNPKILNHIETLIETHQDAKDKKYRELAYFIYGKTLTHIPISKNMKYYLSLLEKEKDQTNIVTLLNRIEEINIPKNTSPSIIIQYTKNKNSAIRESAILALKSFPHSSEAKETLKDIINKNISKANENEILYAIAAYNSFANTDDIELIKKHMNSRNKDIRESSLYLLNKITNTKE